MAFCANCGNALAEGQRFCAVCGQRVEGEIAEATAGAAGAPPDERWQAQPAAVSPASQPQERQWAPQTEQQVPPPGSRPVEAHMPGWTYYQQGPSGAPGRSRKGLWIGLASALVVVVACVLVFVVFRGDIFGGGGASSPEQAVEKLLAAYEDKDVDAVFDLLDPEALQDVLDGQSVEEAKADMFSGLYDDGSVASIRFSGIKMKVDTTGDDSATVTLTAGKAIITDESGEEDVSDVSEADEPPTIDLIRRDGSWYIDPSSMLLGSVGDGGGTDTTDTTDMGPPTTAAGATTTTLFTTSTIAGGEGAKTPQEVVMRFFGAMEDKDLVALMALFDPVTLEQMAEGMDVEALASAMGSALFTYESIEFSGIEVDVEFQDEANATVTVTQGTVTITESDGSTSMEDVRDADEPVVITVVQRDGYWYADPSEFGGNL